VNRFLRDLTAKPEATRGDCLKAAAVFLGKRENLDDLTGVVSLLREKEVVTDEQAHQLAPGGTDEPELDATESADRGFACLLFKRALKYRGGLLGHIFSSSERYAYRHLEYLRMIPSGGPWVDISGPELVGLISTAQSKKS